MSPPIGAEALRDALVEIGRRQDARAWVPATAGNLSVRHHDPSQVWITASGTHKGRLGRDDILLVDLNGELVSAAPGRRPSAETSLHLAVYRSVPEAQACLHVHTVANTLVHRLGGEDGLELPPLELVKAFGIWEAAPEVSVPVFPNLLRVPDIARLVETRFGHAPPELPGFLIRDHGLTAWGADLERADHALEAFEFLFRAKIELARLSLD
ncbi:MAG: methylthioribulose 1-phosphate dehydratase [Myxococcota bacterium]